MHAWHITEPAGAVRTRLRDNGITCHVLYSTCCFSSCRAAGWVYHDAGRVTACRGSFKPNGLSLLVEAGCV
jgi:hypothetical protein